MVPRQKPPVAQHTLPVAGVLAGLSALGVSLLIVFVTLMFGWLLAAHGQDNTGAVIRASGSAWLAMHLVPVSIGANPLGLLPIGALAVPVIAIRRAMVWATESAKPATAFDRALLAGYGTMTYATIALFISMYSSTSDVMTSDASAVAHTMAIFIVVAATVVVRRSDAQLPGWFIDAARPGLAAGMALIAAGGVLTVVALVMHFEQVSAVTNLLTPDFIDGAFLTLLGVMYVPTAVGWSTSYLLGTAVHLGNGITSIHSSNPGRLPAFPVLAMLQADVPRFAVLLLLVPIVVGVVTFAALPRDTWYPQSNSVAQSTVAVLRVRELRDVTVATLVASCVTGAMAFAASGSLGRDQLLFVGPEPLAVAIATAQWVGGTMLVCLVVPRFLLMVLRSISHRQTTTGRI